MGGKLASMSQADEKIGAIVEAARDLFFDRGYETTSMDLIARKAGVSKATVYAHFRSKEQLLLSLIEDEVNLLKLSQQHDLPASITELEQTLLEIATNFTTLFRNDRKLALSRLVISQAHSFPESALAFYEAGPRRLKDDVGLVLTRAVENALLVIDDIDLASVQFISLIAGDLPLRSLLALAPHPPETIKSCINQGVATFLAAYSPRTVN
jgi:TetR/AcrR family transcriptional regulator, mexJK operon transcriptional repressor